MRAIHDYFVAENAIVLGNVQFSPGVNIWYGCVLRGDLAAITLGQGVNLQDGCIVHTDSNAPQCLEAGVVAGHRAILHGERVGRNTLVGMGAMLLSGSILGEECIIGAGCIVTEGKKIPPRSLVLGVPGKIIRVVTDAELEKTRAIAARYLELARHHATGAFPPPWEKQEAVTK